MATPAALRLRRQIRGLTNLAATDLDVLWRKGLSETGLKAALPPLVATYGAAAAAVAADWYDELRDAQNVSGRFRARPANIADAGEEALVGWAFATAADEHSVKTLLAGGLQRRLANFSRTTITTSSVDDPGADGWQREGSGECAFCAMLIGRGAVYSEASADFASHDHCNCTAVPAFSGEPRPVKPYTPGPRHGNKADYDRAREWIATH